MGAKTSSETKARGLRAAEIPQWQSLMRKLVAETAPGKPPAAAAPNGGRPAEEILFDALADGVRCVLIRQTPADSPSVTLSPREREIARMVAKGLPNKTIADVLEISAWTVSTHLRRIFTKLGVSSRAAMVARMMENCLWEKGPTDHGGAPLHPASTHGHSTHRPHAHAAR